MCNITWLQLSDLHFGYSDQTVRNMREKLKSDAIKNVVSHQIRYQFLIIVGDIVYARCSKLYPVNRTVRVFKTPTEG